MPFTISDLHRARSFDIFVRPDLAAWWRTAAIRATIFRAGLRENMTPNRSLPLFAHDRIRFSATASLMPPISPASATHSMGRRGMGVEELARRARGRRAGHTARR